MCTEILSGNTSTTEPPSPTKREIKVTATEKIKIHAKIKLQVAASCCYISIVFRPAGNWQIFPSTFQSDSRYFGPTSSYGKKIAYLNMIQWSYTCELGLACRKERDHIKQKGMSHLNFCCNNLADILTQQLRSPNGGLRRMETSII